MDCDGKRLYERTDPGGIEFTHWHEVCGGDKRGTRKSRGTAGAHPKPPPTGGRLSKGRGKEIVGRNNEWVDGHKRAQRYSPRRDIRTEFFEDSHCFVAHDLAHPATTILARVAVNVRAADPRVQNAHQRVVWFECWTVYLKNLEIVEVRQNECLHGDSLQLT